MSFQLGVTFYLRFYCCLYFFGAVERQPVVLYHANIKQKQQLYAQVISFHQGKTLVPVQRTVVRSGLIDTQCVGN